MDAGLNAFGARRFGTVVVGGGPAGLICALQIARTGGSVALVEQGGGIRDSLCPKVAAGMKAHKGNLRKAERYRDQCPRCTCLQGVGGAAMHFDSNLGYVRQLSRPKIEAGPNGEVVRFNALERLLGPKAEGLVSQGFAVFGEFGLTPPEEAPRDRDHLFNAEIFAHTDTADSFPAPLALTLPMVTRMERALEEAGAALLLRRRVCAVTPVEGAGSGEGRWRVETEGPTGREALLADNVVLGVGKAAMPWILELLEDLQVERRPAATVDVGVRLETSRADMEWMTGACHYPKLTYLSPRGEAVRTFCVCAGGRMMQYEFADTVILDGQHCIEDPTNRTNFGILTTMRAPAGRDAAALALDMARQVNRAAGRGPLVQTVGDFLARRPTTTLDGSPIRSSLIKPALGDVSAVLPSFLVEDVSGMIERLNVLSPGCVADHALLAAPVVERAYPDISLSSDMECSRPGLFFAGDCSGKIIGITYAVATGLCIGRALSRQEHEVQ